MAAVCRELQEICKVKIGDKFGRLVIIELKVSQTPSGSWKHLCLCSCGNKTLVCRNNLGRNNTFSCGCFAREQRLKAVTKHQKIDTMEYNSWSMMKNYQKRLIKN